MIPVRDIFRLYKIYILLNFTFIQLITIKVWEIMVVGHLLVIGLKTICFLKTSCLKTSLQRLEECKMLKCLRRILEMRGSAGLYVTSQGQI